MGLLKTIKESLFGPKVDYKQLIKEGAIVVDVRTPSEFKSGNYSGSKNIPLSSFKSSINKLKNKQVILVCRSGGRAAQAKSILKQNGIIAYNAGAWQNV